MRPLKFFLGLAAALALAACYGPPPVSPELAQSESLPVKKKKFILFSGERIKFGPYAVDEVRRDTAHSINRNRSRQIQVQLQESYSFRMTDTATAPWRGDCRSDAARKDRMVFLGPRQVVSHQVSLQCFLRPSDSGSVWTLDLSEGADAGGVLTGILSDGNQRIEVMGTRELTGKSGPRDTHTAFEFNDGGHALGAVLLASGSRVLIHPAAGDGMREPLAAAAAALLLYSDSNRKMEEIVEVTLREDRDSFL